VVSAVARADPWHPVADPAAAERVAGIRLAAVACHTVRAAQPR
jgi:hypothetical protein